MTFFFNSCQKKALQIVSCQILPTNTSSTASLSASTFFKQKICDDIAFVEYEILTVKKRTTSLDWFYLSAAAD